MDGATGVDRVTPSIILRGKQQRDWAVSRINMLPLMAEGDAWAVWIAPYSKLRSLEQNAFYWKLIQSIVDAAGHDKEIWHEYMKRKVFGVNFATIGGEIIEQVKSSAKSKRKDFSELIDFVQAWMAENGIPAESICE